MRQKVCTQCKTLKPLSDYYGERRARDGKQGRCKTCHDGEVNARRKRKRGVKKEEGLDYARHEVECYRCGRVISLWCVGKPPRHLFCETCKTSDDYEPPEMPVSHLLGDFVNQHLYTGDVIRYGKDELRYFEFIYQPPRARVQAPWPYSR